MNLKIDKNSIVTITQQLFQYFSDRILSGFLKDGEQLPSIRSLAKDLGISPMTIIKSYGELEKHGLATTIQGKGTFVNQRNNIDKFNEKLGQLIKSNKSMESTVAGKDNYEWQLAFPDYIVRSQFRYNPNLSYANDCLNLSVASLNHRLLPTATILKDAFDLFQSNPSLLSHYPPVQGDPEFRLVISNYLKPKDINASPENILITNGAQQAISLIASTFVGPGDIIIMEAPTYPGAIDLFKSRGAVILTVPVDEEGMRTDILMSLCEKHAPKLIYTMPIFHNPTGFSMSMKRKLELLDIAKYHNCIIVEDDPWSEITYTKNKIRSLKSLDTDGHVVYLKSVSKFLGPSYRLAAIIAEGPILSSLIAAKANNDLGSSVLSQKILVDFMKSNKIENYLGKLNKQLIKRRDQVISLLKAHAPADVTWAVPEGGINLWIGLPPYANVEKLLFHAFTEKNITFLPGTICYPNEVEFNHFRICFAYLDEELLESTIIDLCKIIENLSAVKVSNDYLPVI